MRRSQTAVLGFSFSLFATLAAVRPAEAAGESKRVAVLRFDGPGADRIRAAVVRAIENRDGWEVVSDKRVAQVAKRLGVGLSDGADLAVLARDLNVDAFVEGSVTPGKKARATITIKNGADGETLNETSFAGLAPRLDEIVNATFLKRMGWVIADAKAPTGKATRQAAVAPPPAPEREVVASTTKATSSKAKVKKSDDESEEAKDEDGEAEESVSKKADDDDDESAGPKGIALDVQAGVRMFSRSLKYTDDIFAKLRPYSLPMAPAPSLGLDWYPGVHFTKGFATNVGLSVTADYSVGLASTTADGTKYPTASKGFSFGPRVRLPVGEHEVSAVAAYGTQSFAITDAADGTAKPEIPNVDYKYLRAGIGGRAVLPSGLSLFGSVGYLLVLGSGEMGSAAYFPRSKVHALDGSLGVGYALGHGFEARLSGDLRRYVYKMNPEPGDPQVAGGASDQYVSGSLGIAYRL